jgi:hypothetical protein
MYVDRAGFWGWRILYPLTDILNPGPISNGRFVNKARFATCFELIFEIRELRRDMPSLPDEALMLDELSTGASKSVGSR